MFNNMEKLIFMGVVIDTGITANDLYAGFISL